MCSVTALFTVQAIVEPIRPLFAEIVPGCQLIGIIEDTLIQDVNRAEQVTPAITQG